MDAASGHIKVKFQTHFSTQETIEAIKRCELKARDNGIIIQEHQSDDGSLLTSKSLEECLLEGGQTSGFSGALSHHQNGRAERGVQMMIGSTRRTMSLHSASHWSGAADAGLWPMSVQQAAWIHNHLPSRKTGLSPHNLWPKTKHPSQKSHNAFCPVHVIQKCLSDKISTP